MFIPHTTLTVALFMMAASAFCWGSWANSYKGTRGYRFELFYWDYAVAIFLTSLALAFTLGMVNHDGTDFLSNLRVADPSNLGYAILAGLIFNVANVLLVAGIDMAGLAIAFPVSIGIALVVGVVMSYVQQPKGDATLLAMGVASAVVAIIMDGLAYGQLGEKRRVTRKSLAICVVSGLLMGSFAPLIARAMSRGNTLGPYGAAVFYTLGALLCCFVVNLYLMRHPLVGDPVTFHGYFQAGVSNHMLGLVGGGVWAVGTVFNFVAANLTGVAISYAIGQSAPMVAVIWGICVWKEFAGARPLARVYLALMFIFYITAIVLVSQAYHSS
jgi:glucose uptake protein